MSFSDGRVPAKNEDISALKDLLDQKEALLSLLEATIDATNEGLLVVDDSGKIVASNRRFAELWKMPDELIRRRDDNELLSFALNQLKDPEAFIAKVREVYANREVETVDIIQMKDSRVLERSSRPQKIRGQTTGLVWSFRDITAQRLAEAASAASIELEKRAHAEAEAERKRLEVLEEASRVLADSLDYQATLQAIGRVIVPKLGDWSAIGIGNSASGMRLITFTADSTEKTLVEKITDTILDADAPYGIPSVIRSGRSQFNPVVNEDDLHYREDHWPVVGTRDADTLARVRSVGLKSFMIVPLPVRGKVIGAMSIARARSPIPFTETDLRLAEEIGRRCAIALDSAILYRDALRTIQVREDFLSVASHELRAPLSPLRMQFEMAQLFAKDIPESYAQRSDLQEMMSGASLQMDRLLRLVDNLLDVSRITAGRLTIQPDWFDLVELVDEILIRLRPSLKTGQELSFRPSGPIIGYWDRSRIDQVLTNLLLNAIKFGEGKPIQIGIENSAGETRLTVRDHGIGVSETDQTRIFDRFERAASPNAYQGFGLGLFISREIVEAHSGRLSVESSLGKGAAFTMKLPMKRRL